MPLSALETPASSVTLMTAGWRWLKTCPPVPCGRSLARAEQQDVRLLQHGSLDGAMHHAVVVEPDAELPVAQNRDPPPVPGGKVQQRDNLATHVEDDAGRGDSPASERDEQEQRHPDEDADPVFVLRFRRNIQKGMCCRCRMQERCSHRRRHCTGAGPARRARHA